MMMPYGWDSPKSLTFEERLEKLREKKHQEACDKNRRKRKNKRKK